MSRRGLVLVGVIVTVLVIGLAVGVLSGIGKGRVDASDAHEVEPDVLSTSDREAVVERRDITLRFALDAATSPGAKNTEQSGSRRATIDVVAQLTPIQYLRFESAGFRGRATVETVMGQRQFACVKLWAVPSTNATDESAADLRCSLPKGAETVGGLRGRLDVESKATKDVLVAPNLFIGYDEKKDEYFVNRLDGDESLRTPIEVGISDGVARVIKKGVKAGDRLTAIEEAP